MMNKYFSVILYLLIHYASFGQLTIRVTSIPTNTPVSDHIYIAGTMNNWNPGSATYQLIKDNEGNFVVTFTPTIGIVKFKFTRGSWDKVEGTTQGNFIPDRTVSYNGMAKTIDLTIYGWEGNGNQISTASSQVSILSDTFYMPQLNKRRKIWLYLPKDYQSSSKDYPVLYMHDGQNLFDKTTSFSGEWNVDEALDSMIMTGDHGCIVVAIDNGSSSRLDEYSPWINPQYGGGQGDQYVEFIVNTLKPFIDQNYRTKPDAPNTGIMGSSMGGLISMYAGIKYPSVFGKVGALSSSYWFSTSSFDYVAKSKVNDNSYFYLIAGDKEGGNQVLDMATMYQILVDAGGNTAQIFKEIHADGQHSEWYWRREFPNAYKWLFEKKTSAINESPTKRPIKIYQQDDWLKIEGPTILPNQKVSIFNFMGCLVNESYLTNDNTININNMKETCGFYIIKVGNFSQIIFIP